jgi:FAD/FMN-containing dehydrogenase
MLVGGGNGWGVKHCGSASDNVLEFEVVVPAATGEGEELCQLKRVNKRTDPELFWGLKGAGQK